MNLIINLVYIFSSFLFIVGLKKLGSPESARRGNLYSSLGMLIAVVATLFTKGIVDYRWISLGLVLGSLIGLTAARMIAMTGMPEMVALLNGFGGGASLLVGWATYLQNPTTSPYLLFAIVLSIFIGGVTFTGSGIAWGKLGQYIPGKAIAFPGQGFLTIGFFLGLIFFGTFFIRGILLPESFYFILAFSLLFGVMLVLPIGAADMPVVISLLNSCSGLAACAAGFVILNNLLIVSGALVGASGIILTKIMCKGMNRSLVNVLFGGFNAVGKNAPTVQGEVSPLSIEDAYLLLEAANSVCIVPGYGMAVAQAQHTVKELTDLLEDHSIEVKFAIHPVAGRMPGHMNVLLAEANVPYEQLFEMDDVNSTLETVDVCMVIGANDVVNTSARESEESPIYGMPIINADHARTVIVLKRSMSTGFSGLENPLFFKKNTRMLFGDAKTSIQGLVSEFKS
jgi:H+-translocating NAD(P) transhydrogenase subunit beta